MCVAPQAEFDDLSWMFEFQDPLSMSTALDEARLYDDKSMKTDLQKIGLVDMKVSESTILEMDVSYRSTVLIFLFSCQHPLWDLPYNNIYQTVTPDMLHQVKKGVWEHLLNLFQQLIMTTNELRTAQKYLKELDARFTFVPQFPGLKSFPRGITKLPQVTGSEYFQIMNVIFTLLKLVGYL